MNTLNSGLLHIISKRNRESRFQLRAKISPKNQKDESARQTGSHHFIWVDADAGAFMCPSGEVSSTTDKIWSLPPPPVSFPTLSHAASPARPCHLLQHTAPFPALGPWSSPFPLHRILFLHFFSQHPPSQLYTQCTCPPNHLPDPSLAGVGLFPTPVPPYPISLLYFLHKIYHSLKSYIFTC